MITLFLKFHFLCRINTSFVRHAGYFCYRKNLSIQAIMGGINMEALLKKKDVSKELGVSGKTVPKRVKQKELNKGNSLKEVLVTLEDTSDKKTVTLHKLEIFDQKFENIFSKLDQLERKVHLKAYEVLSVQVLQHRRELKNLVEKITTVEERLLNIEQEVYEEIASTK